MYEAKARLTLRASCIVISVAEADSSPTSVMLRGRASLLSPIGVYRPQHLLVPRCRTCWFFSPIGRIIDIALQTYGQSDGQRWRYYFITFRPIARLQYICIAFLWNSVCPSVWILKLTICQSCYRA